MSHARERFSGAHTSTNVLAPPRVYSGGYKSGTSVNRVDGKPNKIGLTFFPDEVQAALHIFWLENVVLKEEGHPLRLDPLERVIQGRVKSAVGLLQKPVMGPKRATQQVNRLVPAAVIDIDDGEVVIRLFR